MGETNMSKLTVKSLMERNEKLEAKVQELERLLALAQSERKEYSISQDDLAEVVKEDFGINVSDENYQRCPSFSFDGVPCFEASGQNINENSLIKYETQPRDAKDKSRSGFRLLSCTDSICTLQDFRRGYITMSPLTKSLVKLKWLKRPRNCLIVKKPGAGKLADGFANVVRFLKKQDINIIVEPQTYEESISTNKQLCSFISILTGSTAESKDCENIDFVVSLGGDGTMIWASSLFPKGVPPVVSFSLGTLGFLTPFLPSAYEEVLEKVIFNPDQLFCTVRARLFLSVFQNDSCQTQTALNELCVDRGPNGSVVNLNLYINGKLVANLQGDGVIVATPTGSTAYSLAAGGSILHPSLCSMAVTPICPHSLTFRPFIVSDALQLKIEVSEESRSTAFVSFDGKRQVELKVGDYVVCKISKYPFVAFCRDDESTDWFNAMKSSFGWSLRKNNNI